MQNGEQEFPLDDPHAHMSLFKPRISFSIAVLSPVKTHIALIAQTQTLSSHQRAPGGKAKVITSTIYIFLKRSTHTNLRKNYIGSTDSELSNPNKTEMNVK